MNNSDFFILLNNNLLLYILSALMPIIIFKKIMKQRKIVFINPIFINSLIFFIGFSTVIFLFFIGEINANLFIYISISSLIFWTIFFKIFNGKLKIGKINIKNEKNIVNIIFILTYLSYLLFNLVTYIVLGIPLLNEASRLATYEGSGFGVLERLQLAALIFSLFYIFKIWDDGKKIRVIILTIPIIIIGILSGSRSVFIIGLFAYWGYANFYAINKINKINIKSLIIIILLIFITFMLGSNGDVNHAFQLLVERIIASGDIYWMSLPNDVWKEVNVGNPYLFILKGLLEPLRLAEADKNIIPVGFQLTALVNPTIIDPKTGPVAVFPVLGLICFGKMGGILFAAFQAIICGVLCKFSYRKSSSLVISSILFTFFFSSIMFFMDFGYAIGAILNATLGAIYILAITFTSMIFNEITNEE